MEARIGSSDRSARLETTQTGDSSLMWTAVSTTRRLEDLAEINEVEDDEKDEYQGFGVYREVDLGIDESLLGVRRYDAGWKDGKAESNNGFVCMWSHLASYFAAAVTVFSINFFSKSIEL